MVEEVAGPRDIYQAVLTAILPCGVLCKVTGRRHRVSPYRSAYFASPWWLLTLDLRRRSREAALLFPES